MDFKFKIGDLVKVNTKYGIFQIVKPVCFKDQPEKDCLKYYVRQIFNKNDELDVQPAILCHESWMDLLSQNTKLYSTVKDKLNSSEIKNIVFIPGEEYRYFTKFKNSAFICCANNTFKELSSQFEKISGNRLNIDNALEILNEFYNKKLIKSFDILKPQQYELEKDENVYLIEVGRFVNDFEIPDEYATSFDRNVKLKKKSVKNIRKK